MSQTPKDYTALRSWREIAVELADETSLERVLELSKELLKALEAQSGPVQKKAS